MAYEEAPAAGNLQDKKHINKNAKVGTANSTDKIVENQTATGTNDDENMEQSDSKCFFFGLFDY